MVERSLARVLAWAIVLTLTLPALFHPAPGFAMPSNALAPSPRLKVSASPPAGTYATGQRVTLAASAPGTIYYTADGSDPTTSPTRAKYVAPFPLAQTSNIRFVAVTSDKRQSPVMSEVYTIQVASGYRDMSYNGSSAPTSKDAESKLWFQAGSWWGIFYDAVSNGWRVYHLDLATQLWSNVTPDGAPLSPILGSAINLKWDALSDGDTLYLVSHKQQSDAEGTSGSSAASAEADFKRLSYNSSAKSYSLDFVKSIAPGTMETFVIVKDTTGAIWGAFTQDNVVKIAHTQGSDNDWTVPYQMPTSGSAVSSDDTAAIVSFGTKVGVMWSNQCPDHNGCPVGADDEKMYFAWHADGAADTAWTAEVAYFVPGKKGADDHINLKADSTGRVYAAAKTSFTKPTDPLINLLVRLPNGTWNAYPFATAAKDHTRAIVLIDEEQGMVFMFAASPTSGGAIYCKQSHLTDIAFGPGLGTPIVQSADDPSINNATSTKQNVTSVTGLLVLASDSTTGRYVHAYLDLKGAPPCT